MFAFMKVRLQIKKEHVLILKYMLIRTGGASRKSLSSGNKSKKTIVDRMVYFLDRDHKTLLNVPFHEYYKVLGIEAAPLPYSKELLNLLLEGMILTYNEYPDFRFPKSDYDQFLVNLEEDHKGAGRINTTSLISFMFHLLNEEVNTEGYIVEARNIQKK